MEVLLLLPASDGLRRSRRVVTMRTILGLACALTSFVTSSAMGSQGYHSNNDQCRRCLRRCSDTSTLFNFLLCNSCIPSCKNRTDDLAFFFLNNKCTPAPWQQLSDPSGVLFHFLTENRGRFAQRNEIINSTEDPMAESRVPIVKSYRGIRRQQAVCPTLYTVLTPTTAQHRRSGATVNLLSMFGMNQFFFVGQCKYKQPVFDMHPPGKCRITKSNHKAIFTLTHDELIKGTGKYRNCRLFDSKQMHYVCDDWVRLNSSCSLYI